MQFVLLQGAFYLKFQICISVYKRLLGWYNFNQTAVTFEALPRNLGSGISDYNLILTKLNSVVMTVSFLCVWLLNVAVEKVEMVKKDRTFIANITVGQGNKY